MNGQGALKSVTIVLCAATVFSACSPQMNGARSHSATGRDASRSSEVTPQPKPQAPAGASARNAERLAAAEIFETLTETAFKQTKPSIMANISKAKSAAWSVRTSMSGQTLSDLDHSLSALTSAAAADDRASLAIASVEAFRALVSSVEGEQIVPVGVSLLDYAGFRFDADLHAPTPRWIDAEQAAIYAAARWSSLALQISDLALRRKVDNAIKSLASTAASKQIKAGRVAAKVELDLVDDLEIYFNKHARKIKYPQQVAEFGGEIIASNEQNTADHSSILDHQNIRNDTGRD